MTTGPEQLSISLDDGTSVTGFLYRPSKAVRSGVTLILGHGAGAGQLHPFMQLFASGLAERGIDVLTFNFQYMEQGRRVPDPKAKLESCYRAVIEAARNHKKLKQNRVVIGGKSMGGRIASQVAALVCGGLTDTESHLDCGGSTPLSDAATHSSRKSKAQKTIKELSTSPIAQATARNIAPAASRDISQTTASDISQTPAADIAGLVFLGYPLHPPGKPDQRRDTHLPQITAPMLFVQGSRDAFGTPDELRATIKKHHLPATLHVVAGGDHSLKVPKSSGVTQADVYTSALNATATWILKLRR
jgi:predicted alpha/beta-hydrolase family hydrolase